MQIYNTATRRKEELVTHEPGKVAMYACGPTVYNYIHIGNARTFLIFDMVRKYLKYRGYEVAFVQNITDVDDKIIKRAQEEGKTPEEIAAFYTKAFIDNMHTFGIDDPDVRPRATQEIPEMIELVQRLIDRGHAYEVDGDVYFSVRSFPKYGELSGRNVDDLQSGARVDVDERKRDPLDFALWKAAKPGEPHWSSPWGEGRPGWHLECSAMSQKYLGVPLDVHGGGSDLVFPHHENERAQSEAAFGCTFSNYWMHGGMLQINHEKMSKSLGNFLLLRDVLKTTDARVLRMLMLQTHYRSPLDFSDERLGESEAMLSRLTNFVKNTAWLCANAEGETTVDLVAYQKAIDDMCDSFIEAMDDDFNTADALAAVFELVKFANTNVQEGSSKEFAGHTLEVMTKLCDVLGLTLEKKEEILDEEIENLIAERQAARKAKDFARADEIRGLLLDKGIELKDTREGVKWKRI